MINKKDFIELEYIGKVKDGEVFDTNIKEEAKKINLDIKVRPLIICLGQNQILPAIDEFLVGKEEGRYTLELTPEKAFGIRNRDLIKTLPVKVFIEKQIMPQQGMIFQFDNLLGKITAVSGGRVIVDFNNPLAGKVVVYELNVKKKITDEREKINSFQDYFFGKRFEFNLQDKKLIIKAEKKFKQLIEMFKDKFKEALDLELEAAEEPQEKKENLNNKK